MNTESAPLDAPAARRKGEAGFTLLELMIVCAVIGIIANIAIPGLISAMYRAKAGKIIEDYTTLRTMVHQYYADKSSFPGDQGPGIEPPELSPYLQSRIIWDHGDYQYDWELWEDSAGVATQPGTGVMVGFSIVTTDPALTAALHHMYKGIILDTIPNHTTFVIQAYPG
jgi:prepilin-type N-terminal cleavage/methylation domain-containing protein